MFYKAKAKITKNKLREEYVNSVEECNKIELRYRSELRREAQRKLEKKAENYSRENNFDVYVFVYEIELFEEVDNRVELYVICKKYDDNVKKHIGSFVDKCGIKIIELSISETTFGDVYSSCDHSYYANERIIDTYFHYEDISEDSQFMLCKERLVETKLLKNDIYKKANNLYCNKTLIPEIDRIFENKRTIKYIGNPVQYIITCSDKKKCLEITDVLIAALKKQKRLESNRIWISSISRTNKKVYGYEFCQGSSIGIFLPDLKDENSEYKRNEFKKNIINIGEMIQKNSSGVLSFVFLKRGNDRLKELLCESASNTIFYEIKEDVLRGKEARDYLLCKADQIGMNSDLFSEIDISDKISYYPDELDRRLNKNIENILCKNVYSQYNKLCLKNYDKNKQVSGNAYNDLMSMVGLNSPKNAIDKIINYYKSRNIYKSYGIKPPLSAVHMVFTGNPGTAKTTVARLFAAILKDNNILSEGNLIEVGRADLVGEYVGETAPKVKNIFKIAKGSVLFIDEAYSLIDGKRGYYGDEAINTIVQEMENNREDTIVIFAGYPDKMKQFLDTNQGLKSRIAFHIMFDDYTENELYKILNLMVENAGLNLSSDVKEKVIPLFSEVRNNPDYGNGRYVRNVFEQAIMNQAQRMALQSDTITENELKNLKAEDFDNLNVNLKDMEDNKKVIGF